jgi:hypothetical protein
MWVATLSDGDHVVRMPASGDSWFTDPVTFTLSASATIIILGDTTSSPMATWTATAGTASDPKNPWPPPLPNKIDVDPGADPLGGTLITLNSQVSVDRSLSPTVAEPDRLG